MGIFKRKKDDKNNEDVFDLTCIAVRDVLSDDTRRIKLTPKTKIESLGIDSIKYLNLLISLEDIIGKDLDEIVEQINIEELITIGDLVELIMKHKSV